MILHKAEAYAEKQGNTLEGILKEYIETLSIEDKKPNKTFSPRIMSLRGCLEIEDKDIFDYKKIIEEERSKYYWSI